MSEFIRPDKLYRVPIQGGEIVISPSHDFMHHWQRNGAWMLKYWDSANVPPRMVNLVMAEESARWLMDNCGIEMMEREFMGQQEHDHYLAWLDANLDDLDFEPSVGDEGDGTLE